MGRWSSDDVFRRRQGHIGGDAYPVSRPSAVRRLAAAVAVEADASPVPAGTSWVLPRSVHVPTRFQFTPGRGPDRSPDRRPRPWAMSLYTTNRIMWNRVGLRGLSRIVNGPATSPEETKVIWSESSVPALDSMRTRRPWLRLLAMLADRRASVPTVGSSPQARIFDREAAHARRSAQVAQVEPMFATVSLRVAESGEHDAIRPPWPVLPYPASSAGSP